MVIYVLFVCCISNDNDGALSVFKTTRLLVNKSRNTTTGRNKCQGLKN